MAVTLDSVVSREAAWFIAEPPASFLNAPPLISTATPVAGPFATVQGYWSKLPARSRAVYINRERTIEQRISMGGEKEWQHSMLITVLWSFTTGSGSMETEMQNLDTGIAAVVTRIRGPQGDKTHGGAFLAVAEGVSGDERIDIDWGDAVQQLTGRQGPLEVKIRYVISETFTG